MGWGVSAPPGAILAFPFRGQSCGELTLPDLGEPRHHCPSQARERVTRTRVTLALA